MEVSLVVPSTATNQTSRVSVSTTGTKSLETQTMGKAPQIQSMTKLGFVTSVDATRILLTSARLQNIWKFSTNNPKDAKHLKGKGLKPTSTFIQMAPTEMVVRKMFLLYLATPLLSSCQR